jgi:hypothetical protein
MGRLRVPVRPFASCTWKIKGNGKNVWVLDLPVGAFKVEGVPEIAPFMEFNVRPDGSFPVRTDQVYGAVPPEALRAAEYGIPELAIGKDFVVMTSCSWAEAAQRKAVASAHTEEFKRDRFMGSSFRIDHTPNPPLVTLMP